MGSAGWILDLLKKHAPKLGALVSAQGLQWLTNPQNRALVNQRLAKLKSRRRAERVRARCELTLNLLESSRIDSGDPARKQSAQRASDRVKRLLIQLNLPLKNRAERKANVQSVADGLDQILDEIRHVLGGESDDGPDGNDGTQVIAK